MVHSRKKVSISIHIDMIPLRNNTYPQIFWGENIYWQHLDLNLQPQDYESDALPLHQEEITESLHTLKDWKHCISRFTLYLILVKIHCILKCWHWASSSCISHISCIVSYWGWSSSFKFWHWLVLLWDVLGGKDESHPQEYVSCPSYSSISHLNATMYFQV